jgi:hypothetical protein
MHSTQAGKDEDLEHQNRHNSADRPLDIAAQATSSALFATTPQRLAANQIARSPFQSSSPHVRNGPATSTPAIGSTMTQHWVTGVHTALLICPPAKGSSQPRITTGAHVVLETSIDALRTALLLQHKVLHAQRPSTPRSR